MKSFDSLVMIVYELDDIHDRETYELATEDIKQGILWSHIQYRKQNTYWIICFRKVQI